MMLIVGDITWHAENVAFYIKRMHQLQKKVEQSIIELDKEAKGNHPLWCNRQVRGRRPEPTRSYRPNRSR